MKQKLNKNLLKIIVDQIIFLEFSSEDIIDSDAAMQAIENIASEIQIMNDLNKQEIITDLNEIVDQYPEEQKDFVKNLPMTLGII